MDKLSELPPKNDNVKSNEESEIMNKFFPGNQLGNPQGNQLRSPQSDNSGSPQALLEESQPLTNKSSKINWKLIGLSTALFLALANPWIDDLFCNVPYCGNNAMSMLGCKVLLFITLMILISIYC